jgi:hypothetical protein
MAYIVIAQSQTHKSLSIHVFNILFVNPLRGEKTWYVLNMSFKNLDGEIRGYGIYSCIDIASLKTIIWEKVWKLVETSWINLQSICKLVITQMYYNTWG